MSIPFSNRDSSAPRSKAIGTLGEQFVQAWLNQQGCEILSHQYRCRWGEIDLIARESDSKLESTLIFVEVKTRSKRNWDEDGLLAITPGKQRKLIKSAKLFLSENPKLVDFPCRFDVALVRCDRLKISSPDSEHNSGVTNLSFPGSISIIGQPIEFLDHKLTLQSYILSAFGDEGSF